MGLISPRGDSEAAVVGHYTIHTRKSETEGAKGAAFPILMALYGTPQLQP